jgi:hypothetical protein
METLTPEPEARVPGAKILWLVLVALAALLRLGPITSGLPYFDYIDEGHIFHPVIRILNAESDPSPSVYPPFTSYLIVAAAKGYTPLYLLFHRHGMRRDLPTDRDYRTVLGERYDLVAPPEIIWLGRLVVACLSIGTVVVAGALAKSLGGTRAGLLAVLFAALCPALVSRGSLVIIDTTATFFALVSLYLCQRLRLRLAAASNHPALWRDAGYAGIAAGLAFGAKYTVGAVFLAVLVTILTLPLAWKRKTILILSAGAGLFAGVLGGVAGAVFHPERIVALLRGLVSGDYQAIRSDQSYWSAAFSGSEVGVPLMVTALVAIIWMGWNASTRRAAVSWIAFALLLLSAVVWANFQPFRNLLSLVPLLCIAAALLCDRLLCDFEHRDRSRSFISWLAVALIFLIAFSSGRQSLHHLQLRTTQVDTRVRAIDWLKQHATKEQTVLGLRELAILPGEWKRIEARCTVVPWFEALDLLDRQQFDYVVTGELDLRYATDPAGWAAYRDRWQAKVLPLAVQADYGQVVTPVVPYLWRTTNERILILKGNVPE